MYLRLTKILVVLIGLGLWATPVLRGQYNPRALVGGSAPQIIEAPEQPDAFVAHWPIEVNQLGGKITIYEPQMESLDGDTLTARAAVSIAQPDAAEPTYGVVWFKSRILVDRDSRVVHVVDLNITQTRIPDGNSATETAVRDAITSGFKDPQAQLSYDQLLTMLETTKPDQQPSAPLRFDAPRVVFVEHPAIKIQYDGDPKLLDVVDSPLKRVVNTPFFVVQDKTSGRFFLKGGGVWYDAPDALGPFVRASRVPQEAIALADQTGYRDPQEPLAADLLDRLEIITATEPTELIWTDGPPQMGTIPGTLLLHATNTPMDYFVSVATQRSYILLSGRWYEAKDRQGPWTFVPPDHLPADFAKIPANSPRGDVLAHVSGTPQAKQAVADAFVPQTAAVNRHDFEQPAVQYDGDPRFEPVEGTSLTYAANSPQSVIRVGDSYYTCSNAVWYVSSSPTGPWDLCTHVPDAVYSIPPSSPIYPVSYVRVYDSSPDYVYTGYTAGYLGSYVYDGAIVYGTGYSYDPWWGGQYYGRPCTYGYGARYDSYGYGWGFGFGFSTGGGSLWIGYNQYPGSYCSPWFGYGGYYGACVPFDYHYHHYHYDYHDHGNSSHDYHNQGNSSHNEWHAQDNRDQDRTHRANAFGNERDRTASAQSLSVYNRRSDVRQVSDTSARTTGRSAGQSSRGDSTRNDVLAARDGRVFRRADDGDWQVRDSGKWRSEGRSPTVLSNEPAARSIEQHPSREARVVTRSAQTRSTSPGSSHVLEFPNQDSDQQAARSRRSSPSQSQWDPEVIRPTPSTRQPAQDPTVTRQNRSTARVAPSGPEDRPVRTQDNRDTARRTQPQNRFPAQEPRVAAPEQQNAGGQGDRWARSAPAPREAPQPSRDTQNRVSAQSSRPPTVQRSAPQARPTVRSEVSSRPSAPAPAPQRSSGSAGRGGGGGQSRDRG